MKENRIPKSHWLRNIPIAHRGMHDESFPENSIPAFRRAVEEGFAIELDVRLSLDGVIFVHHDLDTKRMTGEKLKSIDQSIARLRQLRLAGTVYRIPTLDEVLEVVGGRVPILIEIKSSGNPGPLEKKLCRCLLRYEEECGADHSELFAIQSFDPRVIRKIRKIDSRYLTGQLSQNMSKKKIPAWQKWLLTGCYTNLFTRPDFINYRYTDLPVGRITKMRRDGMPVSGWTIRTESEIAVALKQCDNFAFDGFVPEGNRTDMFR